MDDLESPNVAPEMEALRAVREREHSEVTESKKLRWWATEIDWVLMLVVPIVVLVVAAILSGA